ncbi:GNAT family N-acetyltransferase [Kribbella qitaiheensis]|uniref:GNAT family N-acetyltransferase n=2 Tax=Kribbella qitaiheensis TaxID=1544730 RepID=A0A7G6XAF6_9ACTN|nr:GNAT family N-acetyltransferase [Kribbella qitaiheensis]
MRVRRGGRADVPAVLGLLDGATEWLVARGRADQWGTEPHSTNPRRIEQITGFAEDGGLWIAEAEDPDAAGSSADAQRSGVQVVGALAVGEALSYVPAATEPELYVRLLVTDRRLVGQGIGTQLLDHARLLARATGAGLLRVDCFAGGDGALIRYYEKQGFTRAEQFAVPVNDSEWLGQVLIQRL